MSANGAGQEDAVQTAYQRARQVMAVHQDELLAKPNVVGVGVGFRERRGARTDAVAIVVMVSHKVPRERLAPEELIPGEIEGVPVDVQQVGRLSPQACAHQDTRARIPWP